jgi:hypothetical protein
MPWRTGLQPGRTEAFLKPALAAEADFDCGSPRYVERFFCSTMEHPDQLHLF